MKIKSVDIFKCVKAKGTNPSIFTPIVVRINTDEGISGYGEAGLTYGDANHAAFGICRDYASWLIGRDPFDSEKIWEDLLRLTFWGMGGGAVINAGISAIDIALWDIKGKALNVPCYKLLGGKTNEKLRAYASQIQFDWGPKSKAMITPEDYGEAARHAIEDGYDAVKVDPIGYDMDGNWLKSVKRGFFREEELDMAYERVKAIRDAGGEGLDIIIELHALTDRNSSVQLAARLKELGCMFVEEATMPLNSALMKNIAKEAGIPLAAGERIYTRWGFRPFLEDGSLAVLQPDLGNTGGITEGKKICDMAHTYDVGIQLHICGGPLATAAALQLEAVIPNFIIHEHHAVALLEENIALCKYDYQPENGFFQVPERPGIGNELSEYAIKTSEVITVK